jgi:hypothetical protein
MKVTATTEKRSLEHWRILVAAIAIGLVFFIYLIRLFT